jgi:glutaredoxin 2
MKIKLYHYVHCPFCVRVRMTLGYLNLPYESIVLPYHDEKTPLSLTGIKMLPIAEINGKLLNESLDIMALLDQENKLNLSHLKQVSNWPKINGWLDRLGKNIHNLAMPYWIYTPEFDETSRQYFQTKKEAKRGSFKNLVKNRQLFENELTKDLSELEKELIPFFQSRTFTAFDILLASHLWGLYIVPEFQFSKVIHDYLQTVKKLCHFDYHEDFWNR